MIIEAIIGKEKAKCGMDEMEEIENLIKKFKSSNSVYVTSFTGAKSFEGVKKETPNQYYTGGESNINLITNGIFNVQEFYQDLFEKGYRIFDSKIDVNGK